jgi:large subunit ribosomal protein L13
VISSSSSTQPLRVTGAKSTDKIYYRHSGYPGGITATNFRDMQMSSRVALEKSRQGHAAQGRWATP